MNQLMQKVLNKKKGEFYGKEESIQLITNFTGNYKYYAVCDEHYIYGSN